MKKKFSKKIAKSVTVPLVLTLGVTTINSSNLVNTNIVFAEQKSDGFSIEKPYLENGSLKLIFNGTDKSSSFFDRYWSQIDKVLIDGKDFGFNNKSTASKDYYHYYDGVVTANSAGVTEHFQKNSKHKIEVIFLDGSKAVYEDEGYTGSENNVTENNEKSESKYKISKIEKDSNWKGEQYLAIELEDTSIYDEFKEKIFKIEVDGSSLTQEQIDSAEVSKWFGIRIFDSEVAKLFDKDSSVVKITLKDGEVLIYPDKESEKVETPKEEIGKEEKAEDTVNLSYSNKDIITSVDKNPYGDELLFTLSNGTQAKDLLSKTRDITINGKTYPVENFKVHWSGKINSIAVGDGLTLFKEWKEKGRNTVVFNFKDNTSSNVYSVGEDEKSNEQEQTYSLTDKLEDGEYTIGFNALYADGREGSSMLEGFFDKNAKLTVKDGKMSISMLNTLFAYSLYDFAIQNNNTWNSSEKEYFGNKNSAGQYDKALFTLPIEDLDKEHLAGVIVGHMGGLQSDIGNFDKYTKVKIKFKPEIKKGWKGFDLVVKEEEAKKNSSALLQKKLIANGVDTNNDGVVSPEELYNFNGEINIGAIEINGATDKGEIYNVELLKNMGPGVTSFTSDSNSFGDLQEDLFKNAVNIERINLGGNKVTSLPENLFSNNKKLKSVNLSANNLGTLPENLFKNNTALETIQLDQAWLSSLPNGIFSNNTNLKSLGLASNKLVSLPDDVFKNNSLLEFVDLGNNELSKLPESVANLPLLKGLHAANNNISELPTGLDKSEKLSSLTLNYNNIATLSNNVWKNLAKNNSSVYLVGNQLSSIPLDVIKENGKIRLLDVANNNLPADLPYSEDELTYLGIYPTSPQGYYPQKKAASLTATAKNGKITVSPENNMTILNLLHWFRGRSAYFGGEGILQGTKKYDEFIKGLKEPLATMLKGDDYGRNWDIVTKVERIRGNDIVEISNTRVSNEDDSTMEVLDPTMQAGDIYKITKTLYENSATRQNIKITDLQVETTAIVDENSNKKKYTVPVSMIKAYEDGLSMGNGALEQVANVVEDENGIHITLTFKPLYLEAFKMSGHLTKLGIYPTLNDLKNNTNLSIANATSTYEDNGTQFPKNITFTINSKEKEVGARVWVDAMDDLARLSGQQDGAQNTRLVFNWEEVKNIVGDNKPHKVEENSSNNEESNQGIFNNNTDSNTNNQGSASNNSNINNNTQNSNSGNNHNYNSNLDSSNNNGENLDSNDSNRNVNNDDFDKKDNFIEKKDESPSKHNSTKNNSPKLEKSLAKTGVNNSSLATLAVITTLLAGLLISKKVRK